MHDAKEGPEPISAIQSLRLDLPPSCVEFCPVHPSYLLIGTYNLQKEEDTPAADEGADDGLPAAGQVKAQNRNGSIVVFRMTDKALCQVQSIPQPSAILDLHFNNSPGHQEYCGVVSSTGTLSMFKLSPDESQPLKHLRTMHMATMAKTMTMVATKGELLILSFCWHPTRADVLAITTSSGHVHVVYLGSKYDSWTMHSEPLMTHSLEAWCVAISAYPLALGEPDADVFTIFSGGDDSVLRYRACTRRSISTASDGKLTIDGHALALKGCHDAGVTAILPLPIREGRAEFVVTGSYDDHIRLLFVPDASIVFTAGATSKLAESNLGGGVWRLKLVSFNKIPSGDYVWQATILASCMHGGTKIIKLSKTTKDKFRFTTIGSFTEHKSMNYGSDFQPSRNGALLVVSTSFYDKLLCMWEFEEVKCVLRESMG